MLCRRSFMCAVTAAAAVPKILRAEPLTVASAGLIFTQMEIGGKKANALIDSGSVRGLQLTAALASELGLKLAESGEQVQRYQGSPRAVMKADVPGLRAGGANLGPVAASVSPGDIENISGQIGEPFDAILGWPLLSSRSFAIDYAGKDFSFRQAKEGGLVVPLAAGASRLPLAAGSIDGKPVTFLVDTGAPWCKIDPQVSAAGAAGGRVELPFAISGRQFSAQFNVRDLGALSRGTGALAVLGHRFLEQFSLAWDSSGQRLRLI